jgi:formylglycine-generating enzyme required for sulfatase activity/tRNA A-37 threonylcarbamoyl transferase component Bud32
MTGAHVEPVASQLPTLDHTPVLPISPGSLETGDGGAGTHAPDPVAAAERTFISQDPGPVDEQHVATLASPWVEPPMDSHDGSDRTTRTAPLRSDSPTAEVTFISQPAVDSDLATLDSDGSGRPVQKSSGSVEPGGSIGRFKLDRLLGQGAFGAVYLARDPHLDREIAIKLARSGLLARKSDVRRFQTEAKSAAKLRHPHIVPVYEYGQVEGLNYIAYQFIDGRTLKQKLKAEKRLAPSEAVVIIRKLARALAYAHELGIVHRDIKPDNILLDQSGEPHVADFGLARREEAADGPTIDGTVVGTPAYMSPEQASGHGSEADGRSDVWSLGVMLSELLTGVRPFDGPIMEVLQAVRTKEPKSIRQLDPSLPKDLETIVTKALTKNVNERLPSATFLAEELERWERGEPILSRPIGVLARTGRWMRRNPQVAGLLGTVGVVLMVGVLVSSYFAIEARKQTNLMRQARLERERAQIQAISTAEPAAFNALIANLDASESTVVETLRRQLVTSGEHHGQRLRNLLACLALAQDAPERDAWWREVHARLESATAPEVVMIARTLQPRQDSYSVDLWADLETAGRSASKRFRAATMLAAWQVEPARWENVAPLVAAELTARAPLELPEWLRLVEPARDALSSELRRLFVASKSPDQRRIAAEVLGRLYQDQPAVLVGLMADADVRQFPGLTAGLAPTPELHAELQRQLARCEPVHNTLPTQRPAAARRQANLLLAALELETPDVVAELLRLDTGDVRREWTQRAESVGLPPERLMRLVVEVDDPRLRAAACLALGRYEPSQLPPASLPPFREQLAIRLNSDPDPGVHAAIDWLTRQWGQLVPATPPGTLKLSDDRGWLTTDTGETLTVFVGPREFLMGSPDNEPFHSAFERSHRRRIPWHFGVGQREVSITEFQRFDPEHEHNADVAPEAACPVNDVTWWDAVKYCRWLSERAGLPEDEMVYPPLDQIGPMMVLPDQWWLRRGYRLPTSAEWEHFCRGGEPSSRSSGEGVDDLDQYAWYAANSRRRSWPTGRLTPNPLGGFDLHGNVMEWCADWYFDDYPKLDADGRVIDLTDTRKGIYREVRGGSYENDIELIRTADRDYDLPANSSYVIGFRIARTLSDEELAAARKLMP